MQSYFRLELTDKRCYIDTLYMYTYGLYLTTHAIIIPAMPMCTLCYVSCLSFFLHIHQNNRQQTTKLTDGFAFYSNNIFLKLM